MAGQLGKLGLAVVEAYSNAAAGDLELGPPGPQSGAGEIQNPPQVPPGPTLCEMFVRVRYETKDIVNLTVTETNVNHDSWSSYDRIGAYHSGSCSGKTVNVRLGVVPIFTTHWIASGCRGEQPRAYGSYIRTHARAEYWNDDFPLIRIGRIVYPGSVVNVEHNIWVQSHPDSGAFVVQRQGTSWGNNGITQSATYLLSHYLTRGQAQHYCW